MAHIEHHSSDCSLFSHAYFYYQGVRLLSETTPSNSFHNGHGDILEKEREKKRERERDRLILELLKATVLLLGLFFPQWG